MKSLRILTVADVPPDPNSGAAGTVYQTNLALQALGHRVTPIWSTDLGTRRIQHGNLHSLWEQPIAYRNAIRRAVSSQEFDVVQISQPQGYLAAKDLRLSRFGGVVINRSHGLELRVDAILPEWHRRLRVPESRFPRSLLTPLMRRLLQRQWPLAVKYSDGVVVPCEDDREFLLSAVRVDPSHVRTIHHGIPDEYCSSPRQPMDRNRRRRLLFVGQPAFFKGPHLVAQIFNKVLAAQPELTATWVTSEAGMQEARNYLSPEVQKAVSLEPWRAQNELMSLYDTHGVFLFPSLVEGAAKASLEAMSRGMLVVATNGSGMKDYIRDEHSGYLCEIGNVGEFATRILKATIQTPDDLAETISGNAAEYAQQKTWRMCASGLTSFYEYLISAAKTTPGRGC